MDVIVALWWLLWTLWMVRFTWQLCSLRGYVGRAIEFMVVRVLVPLFPKNFRIIPRISDGQPLLRQFKIASFCHLQSFCNPEGVEFFHLHRWRRMLSIVLSGELVEERYPGRLYRVHVAPEVYMMDDTDIHRIKAVEPRTWTLFFMVGENEQPVVAGSGWGYYPRPEGDCGYVPFDKQIPASYRVSSL